MNEITEIKWNEILKKEFEIIHKDYCKHYKSFLKEFDKIFSNSKLTEEEYKKFLPCIENYAKIVNIVKLDLDEFMEDVNKSATIGPQNYNVDDPVNKQIMKLMMICYLMSN